MRRLALRKETLGALGADELRAVVGGYPTGQGVPTYDACPFTAPFPTMPLAWCLAQHTG